MLQGPFINPIEKVFSEVKSFIARHGSDFRRRGFVSDKDRVDLLNLAYEYVTPGDLQSFVKHCGF
jgi:hypothetical protein